MFSLTSTKALSSTAVFSAILLLGGCGGGSGATEPPGAEDAHAHDHEGALTPPDSAAPAPVDTALPDQNAAETSIVNETITLAPTFTAVGVAANNVAYWPTWYGNAQPYDGVKCLVSAKYHKHALLSIYKDGKRLGLASGIGNYHTGCYHAYEMHVHDVSGMIHMETDYPVTFKMGQWFSLWQQPLSRDNVAGLVGPVRFYIIENNTITRYDGNPYDIEMLPHREVLIVTGTAMSVVPKYQWPLGI